MKFLIDMNLSPSWVEVFTQFGFEAAHWSVVGDARASDQKILMWAAENGWIVFTHDLDFGSILAVTKGRGPSVIQVRTQDVMPGPISGLVLQAIRTHKNALEMGSLIVIEEARAP